MNIGWCLVLFSLVVLAQSGFPPYRQTWLRLNRRQTYFENNKLVHHRQKRWEFSTYKIMENLSGPQRITTLRSSFDDGDGDVRYTISGQGAGTIFRVNPVSGVLTALHALDREVQSSYHLNVSAKNLQGIEVENSSVITIEVGDRNDNPPQFSPRQYHAFVKELSPIGTLVTTVTAIDRDSPNGPYGQVEYSFVPSNDSSKNKFNINPRTGEVKTATSSLDREKASSYTLKIQARDDPGSLLFHSATATLTITVTDVNDKRPIFRERPYKVQVRETTAIGADILVVQTDDADSLDRNTATLYSILPGPDSSKFSIKTVNNEGHIQVQTRLDYETALNREYHFLVKASNVHLETDPRLRYFSPLDDTTDVIVMVTDVNEPPEFTKSEYFFSVREDAEIKSPIYSVSASDPEGDTYTFWLDDESDTFYIDPKTGMISLKKKLDREVADSFQFHVMAGRRGRADWFSTVTVNMRVIDVNDNPPMPLDNSLELVLCESKESATQPLRPSIIMTDADSTGNGAPFHFTLFDDEEDGNNFRLLENSGEAAFVYPTHNNFHVTDEMEYKIRLFVQDSGTPPMNATYLFNVRVCYCDADSDPVCHPVYQEAVPYSNILVAVAVVLCIFLLIVVVIVLIFRRRRRMKEKEVLIKGSLSSGEVEVHEHFVSYNEEGGGEEDTGAFDLTALQRNYCSSASSSQVRSHSDYASLPSTKVSSLPSYSKTRPFVPSQDIRDFISSKKAAEDSDDRKLAYDSLQVYAYEGEDSEAGSLSSLCSSASDVDHDYDYLNEWGPRFKRLADMYGDRRSMY